MLLEELSKTDMLIAGVAHEFKSPISIINANVDYIGDIIKDDECTNKMLVVKEQLAKLTNMSNDFVNLIKHANSKNIIIYITDLIENILEDYKATYTNINFKLEYTSNNLTVEGNYMLLEICIRNIIKNSIESIGNKKGEITARVVQTEEIIKISIIDNGIGLSDQNKDNLIKNKITTKEDGSGFGLSIVDYIVEYHGGYFDLKNEERGCVATILL